MMKHKFKNNEAEGLSRLFRKINKSLEGYGIKFVQKDKYMKPNGEWTLKFDLIKEYSKDWDGADDILADFPQERSSTENSTPSNDPKENIREIKVVIVPLDIWSKVLSAVKSVALFESENWVDVDGKNLINDDLID